MMSVRRFDFLLLFMVDVEVEFVSRAMLSRVMSFGVEVSRIKSWSLKKFRIVCRWTCARAANIRLQAEWFRGMPLTTREQSGLVYCKTIPRLRNRRNPNKTSSSSSSSLRNSGSPIPCALNANVDRDEYTSTTLPSAPNPSLSRGAGSGTTISATL